MNAKTTKTADTAETPETTMTAFTTLLKRNVERMVDLQKATLDTVSHQNADVLETMRHTMKSFPAAPPELFSLAQQGVEGWIGAQKSILDWFGQQTAQAINVAEPNGAAPLSAAKLSEFVQQAAEQSVATQKTILDFAAKQNKAVTEAIHRQAAVQGTPLAGVTESIHRGVTTLIDGQKTFLDTAMKMTKAAAKS